MEGSVEGRGKGQEGRSFPILLVAVIFNPSLLAVVSVNHL